MNRNWERERKKEKKKGYRSKASGKELMFRGAGKSVGAGAVVDTGVATTIEGAGKMYRAQDESRASMEGSLLMSTEGSLLMPNIAVRQSDESSNNSRSTGESPVMPLSVRQCDGVR